MRSVIVFAALAFASSVVVPRYAERMRLQSAPVALAAAQPAAAAPIASATAASRSVVVPRDPRGHFQVDGVIDGVRLSFMVDTGASVIALTAGDAARFGIHPAPSEFVAQVKTANGIVNAAPIQLDMIEVGDLLMRDVAAVVLPDGALSDNLLGLSFLSRLKRFEYDDGKLVLEQ